MFVCVITTPESSVSASLEKRANVVRLGRIRLNNVGFLRPEKETSMFWNSVSSKETFDSTISTLNFVCALEVTGDLYRMRL